MIVSELLGSTLWDQGINILYKKRMHFLVNLLASALSVFLVGRFLPGVQIGSFLTAIIVAVLIGILNATVGLVLKIITLPLNILTLGLMWFLVNVLMIRLTDYLMDDFNISGFLITVVFAILLALVSALLQKVFGKREKED